PKELRPKKRMAGSPLWTADGKGFLFIGFGGPENQPDDWIFVSIDGATQAPAGAASRLRAAGLGPGVGRWLSAAPGAILFSTGDLESGNIYRIPFDSISHVVSGDPQPVTLGAGFRFSPSASQDVR